MTSHSTSPEPNRTPKIGCVSALIIIALLVPLSFLALLTVRSSVVEPFRIPASSMAPTLLVGDLILVNKRAYGWRYPLTRLPIGEVVLPARGDVVVFVYPGSDEGLSKTLDVAGLSRTVDYLKRVIALPGERVAMTEGVVFINGEPLSRSAAGTETHVDDRCRESQVEVFTEGDSTRSWQTWSIPSSQSSRRMQDFSETVVPAGQLFVLGDNRDHSADSRIWGFVPLENLKGRAESIWTSQDACGTSDRAGRSGMAVE